MGALTTIVGDRPRKPDPTLSSGVTSWFRRRIDHACQSSHHTPLACRYRRMACLGAACRIRDEFRSSSLALPTHTCLLAGESQGEARIETLLVKIFATALVLSHA